MVVTIILFLVIFGVVVISHELGHFLIGRASGIHVLEFAIGMGPTLFHIDTPKTRYSIKLLPLGGACMFDGEDGNYEESNKGKNGLEEEHPGSFLEAGVWARIATVFAGPLFNFILAFILAMILVGFSGTDLPVVYRVSEGMPAAEAGIESGDKIISINGESIHVYRQVTLISQLNRGDTLDVVYEHDGKRMETTITPVYDSTADRYYMGFQGTGEEMTCNSPVKLVQYTFYEVEYWVRATFKSLSMLVTGQVSLREVSGPVGIASFVGETYEEVKPYGLPTIILTMLNIAVLLSVNLGIMNLLPLPALDGGRLVFLLVEVIRGKPVSPEKEGFVHMAGFMAFMVLMVLVMYNDIMKLIP
ncbi:MAG: RIP metalloprotease RseP [Lachnospiraceae bacterium]|nr:RIP metalloprotease RseP [Lachnospiraceae bacterium]